MIELHSELNPKLWDRGRHLDPEVQVALLQIAREFYEFLDFDAPLLDVQITGSQSNYNYSDYSDIDLHLIVPYSQVQCDQPVRDLFDTKRKLWKLEHDITIYEIPVELYVEDRDQPVVGSSYSLLTNTWIRRPKKIQAHWDNAEISRETLSWIDRIRDAISSGDLKQIHELKLELKDYRKQGLAQQGEFGAANLTFKNLRNLGAIEMLVKASTILHDRKLSI